MATTRKASEDRSVARTYRAAVRIGEDYITIEETVTLPVDATDEDVTKAVDLGMRIYQAQREAVEAQISAIREAGGAPAPFTVRDPDSPASDKQRNYIAALQEDLAWSAEQLSAYAGEQEVDLVTMTKGQASTFIDGLKKLAEERPAYRGAAASSQPAPRPAAPSGQPADERQLQALEKLARTHSISLEDAAQDRYGVASAQLTYDQAATLLREFQKNGQQRRVVAS
ncbi:hypothetical protein F8S13_14400 [Chloroflexia bacterium SDU3-3]|nr:hypothetical protein F8S13_14400 [Chloroflexia bacterium SDU3-3]